MRIYLHTPGHTDAEAMTVEPQTKLSALTNDDQQISLLLEDRDEPLDPSLTFEAAEIADRVHIFAGPHEKIDVRVIYNADSHGRAFSASARMAHVQHWAFGEHAFDLTPQEAAEHTLAVLPSDAIPGPDVHVGSLEQVSKGLVELALVSKERYEG